MKAFLTHKKTCCNIPIILLLFFLIFNPIQASTEPKSKPSNNGYLNSYHLEQIEQDAIAYLLRKLPSDSFYVKAKKPKKPSQAFRLIVQINNNHLKKALSKRYKKRLVSGLKLVLPFVNGRDSIAIIQTPSKAQASIYNLNETGPKLRLAAPPQEDTFDSDKAQYATLITQQAERVLNSILEKDSYKIWTQIKKNVTNSYSEPAFILYVKLFYLPQHIDSLKHHIFSELANNISYKKGVDTIKLSIARDARKKHSLNLSQQETEKKNFLVNKRSILSETSNKQNRHIFSIYLPGSLLYQNLFLEPKKYFYVAEKQAPITDTSQTPSHNTSSLQSLKMRLTDLEPVNNNGGFSLHETNSPTGQFAVDLSYSTTAPITLGAFGDYSLAAGYQTKAEGAYSVAFGEGTKAQAHRSMAIGRFNFFNGSIDKPLNEAQNIMFSIGNGTSFNDRHNAFQVHFNGDTKIAGTLSLAIGSENKINATTPFISLSAPNNGSSYTLKLPGNIVEDAENIVENEGKFLQIDKIDKTVKIDESDPDTFTATLKWGNLSSANLTTISSDTNKNLKLGTGALTKLSSDEAQKNNTALGENAGNSLTTGSKNVFVGAEAGNNSNFTSGSSNVFIGYKAGSDTTSYDPNNPNNQLFIATEITGNTSEIKKLISGDFSNGNLSLGQSSGGIVSILNDLNIAGNAEFSGSLTVNNTNILTKINNLETSISSNTTEIAELKNNSGTNSSNSDSQTHTTAIATNETNISTNSSALSANSSNIASNTEAIATNAANISTNTSTLSANSSNIASNTEAINTNTAHIQTNSSSITANRSSINSNSTTITSNTNSINAINSELSTLKSQNESYIDTSYIGTIDSLNPEILTPLSAPSEDPSQANPKPTIIGAINHVYNSSLSSHQQLQSQLGNQSLLDANILSSRKSSDLVGALNYVHQNNLENNAALKQDIKQLESHSQQGIALAHALAAIPSTTSEGFYVAAGTGMYESKLALGLMANYQHERFAVNGGVAFGGKQVSARAGISIKFFDLLNSSYNNRLAQSNANTASFNKVFQPLTDTQYPSNRFGLPHLIIPKQAAVTASRTDSAPLTQTAAQDYLNLWLKNKASQEALLVQQSFESLKTILPRDSIRIQANVAINTESTSPQSIRKIIIDIQLDQNTENLSLNTTLKQDIFRRIAAAIPYVKGRDHIVLSLKDFSQNPATSTASNTLQTLETTNKILENRLAKLISDYQRLQTQVQALKNKSQTQALTPAK